MTSRNANIVVVIVCILFIIYSLYDPLSVKDGILSVMLNLVLNVFATLLLIAVVKILVNIRQIGLYLQTNLLFRNVDIRLSVAYLYRINVHGKYLLVKNRTRNYFQPVGGAFKTLPGSEKIFKALKIKPDRLIETEHGIAKRDLRVHMKGKSVLDFLEWFKSREDRETSPWREFCEELVSTGILPSKEFRYIDYKFQGVVQSPIINLDSGGKGLFYFEIYDLVINDEQKPILEKLREGGNTEKYIWVSDHLIQRLGHEESEKKHTYEIAQHTKYAQNLKWKL